MNKTHHKTKEKGTQHVLWVIYQIVIPVGGGAVFLSMNKGERKPVYMEKGTQHVHWVVVSTYCDLVYMLCSFSSMIIH
jgi:hypothetical protein